LGVDFFLFLRVRTPIVKIKLWMELFSPLIIDRTFSKRVQSTAHKRIIVA
jgi:hypothetical protein